jgi:glutathione synthase/RimK-type ligase-like ATP-grasp enzyme
MRIAQGAEWRTNVHQGGVCVPYELSRLRAGDVPAARHPLIGLEYTGIDLLPGPSRPDLLEVNGAPQWHGLAAATGLDVAGAIIAQRALALARYGEDCSASAPSEGN